MSKKENTNTPMWPLQGAFQISVAKFAAEVFEQLEDKLRPRFFLVGIPQDDKLTVYLEPREESGYNPAFFHDVMNLANEIETAEAAKNAWKNLSGEPRELLISSKSVQEAIGQTLTDPRNNSGLVSYCSEPVRIEGYSVSCVLQFDATAFHSHFSVKVDWRGDTRLPGSLIDATAVEFLEVCTALLGGPRKRIDLRNPLGRQPEDILRMGGSQLMFTASHVSSLTAFEDINKLSWKTHEGELAGGEIYFIHWDNYHLDMPIEFKYPPQLSDTDAARKMIEMAGAKTSQIDK
jgi:hypothetical protein